jgi:hypothetical protein
MRGLFSKFRIFQPPVGLPANQLTLAFCDAREAVKPAWFQTAARKEFYSFYKI